MASTDRPTTMNVSLPASLRAFVEDQVTSQGYSSASEYVRELIRMAKHRESARGKLEELLLQGIESGPAEPFGDEFFDDLRKRIRAARKPASETS